MNKIREDARIIGLEFDHVRISVQKVYAHVENTTEGNVVR